LPSLGVKEHNFGCFLNDQWVGNGEVITSYNPNDNRPIATTQYATLVHYEEGMLATLKTQNMWANTPVPVRGEVVRQIGDAFRLHK